MCIVIVAFAASERHPLMIAANRDERHARPAAAAGWWEDRPGILAGRDLVAGGTWLGVSDTGRVAAVTNIFEPGIQPAPASRGQLVSDFLTGADTPHSYATRIEKTQDRYGPFNLLLYAPNDPAGNTVREAPAGARRDAPTGAERDRGDGATGAPAARNRSAAFFHLSNRGSDGALAPGLHVFGNNRPGEDWPKLERARAGLNDLLELDAPEDAMLALLAERARAPGASPRDSIFVLGAEFGTRSSSVVLIDAHDRVRFVERRFGPGGTELGASRFEFGLRRS